MDFRNKDDLKNNTELLSDRKIKPEGSKIQIGEVEVGGEEIVIMGGPCAVESHEQLLESARIVKAAGGSILRGGAYKPRTSPYSFQGLGEEGLRMLADVSRETGLRIVTEVMDTRQIALVSEHSDILQIGSRNMQNFPLLTEAGKSGKPILLKRGMMATIGEFLLAAEYILKEGNERVMLCERGIRTFDDSSRNTLDLGAIPILKRATHLPVIIDPSHGTGHSWMVPAMSKAAVAAGADGLLVELHKSPDCALSDGGQSLKPEEFTRLMAELPAFAKAAGRKFPVRATTTV